MKNENFDLVWPDISEKLVNRFPKLSKINLELVKGKEDELLKRIEVGLSRSRPDVMALLETL